MVVCLITRLRNLTSRTFSLTFDGGPFYSPQVGGVLCTEPYVEVPPGFNEVCGDILIPWSATTSAGMQIHEQGQPDACVRCCIGPSSVDECVGDWLRLHDAEWEEILQERWQYIGERHFYGTVGHVEELALTFRDPIGGSDSEQRRQVSVDAGSSGQEQVNDGCDGQGPMCAQEDKVNDATVSAPERDEEGVDQATAAAGDEGPEEAQASAGDEEDAQAKAAEAEAEMQLLVVKERHEQACRIGASLHFEHHSVCAPQGTVFLNVFDLASSASFANQFLNNSYVKIFGVFHATIEVYGEEWGFYKQAFDDICGVCRSVRPRHHSVHVYRQSVDLGITEWTRKEVRRLLVRDVLPMWPSSRYDLIHCNCIHFCAEFAKLLKVKPVPDWVTGLHETGASLYRLIGWGVEAEQPQQEEENQQTQQASTADDAAAPHDASSSSIPVPPAAGEGVIGGAAAGESDSSVPASPPALET